jgi:hypothetical protein
VRFAEAPYLDAIIETEQGVLQLLAVDRVWDALLEERTFRQGEADKSDSWAEESGLWDFEHRETDNQDIEESRDRAG